MNIVKRLRGRGVLQTKIVSVVRRGYPKYDRYIDSKVIRPEYGIRLASGADKLLKDAFGDMAKARRKDTRRLPRRVQFRLSEAEYRWLKEHLTDIGYETMQDGMVHVYVRYKSNYLRGDYQIHGNKTNAR
jgi:hypothetical protein